jgi:hypothetical protein
LPDRRIFDRDVLWMLEAARVLCPARCVLSIMC